MCNFRVGQKVVCIDAGDGAPSDVHGCATGYLVKGRVYTVSGIRADMSVVLISVEGVAHAWCDFRFRPVVERGTETGMSILRDILNKTDKPAEVAA